jgi:hypothetical protein
MGLVSSSKHIYYGIQAHFFLYELINVTSLKFKEENKICNLHV